MGELMGVSHQQIQLYESGKSKLSASRLCDLIKIFNIDPTYFFEGSTSDIIGENVRKEVLNTIVPGENQTKKFVADEETRYIALYAEFFRYENSNYKIIFPVTVNNVFQDEINVLLSGNDIRLLK